MTQRSSKNQIHLINWATNVFVKVLQQSESRWTIFTVALCLIAALPNVNGKTHRTDLPDNGFRFLPEDSEKVNPSSLTLTYSSLDGNPQGLKSSFASLATALPVMGILFGLISWRRWRKDQELFETMVEKHQSKKQMLDRSEKLTTQLEEKVDASEWTSVEISSEKVQTVETSEKVCEELELSEKQSYQNLEALDQNSPSEEPAQPSPFPHVLIQIDSQPPVTLDPDLPTSEELANSKIAKSLSPTPEIETKVLGKISLTDVNKLPEELPINDNCRSMLSRKMTRDSIQLHYEKKRKVSHASIRSSI